MKEGNLDATALLAWFEAGGRAHLPWRVDRSPYRVVVSEFMLQQTQVDRVVPAFERFVAAFSSFATLAKATRADVVRAWRGLGYNSRAVRLHELARAVCERYDGELPADERGLRTLPGIGPYTARAILAFAFDADVVAFDVNVRRVVHRTHFGLEHPPRADAGALETAALAALPAGKGFAFNSALMDVGATLCTARAARCLVCPLRAGCAAAPVDAALLTRASREHAPPRSPSESIPFEATARFVRGRVVDALRELRQGEAVSLLALEGELAPLLGSQPSGAVGRAVEALQREGTVERSAAGLRLRD